MSTQPRPRQGRRGQARGATEDDPWDSDVSAGEEHAQGADDSAVAAAAALAGVAGVESASASTSTAGQAPTSTSGSSYWSSFSPFSIISSYTSQSSKESARHVNGPERLAAFLSGAPSTSPPPSAGPSSRRPGSARSISGSAAAANAEKGRKSIIRAETTPSTLSHAIMRSRQASGMGGPAWSEDEDEDDAEDAPRSARSDDPHSSRARKPSSKQLARLRRHVRPDVDATVRDPAQLLQRLKLSESPEMTPSTTQQERKPLSAEEAKALGTPTPSTDSAAFAGVSAEDKASEEEDDDEARGYVRLDATAISSHDRGLIEQPQDDEEYNEREARKRHEQERERRRKERFVEVLLDDNVDIAELRKLAWSGIPDDLRPMIWQLLLGYLPSPAFRRATTLARKRQDYADAVRLAFGTTAPNEITPESATRGGLDGPIWHQISIDVPRTRPGVRLWQSEAAQRALERILYVWAIRHPASGYVQGINDLVTPFFQVFLSSYIDSDPELYDVAALPQGVLAALEADSFWCLSKLLDGIQDNYIFAQPGIVRQVGRMKELCKRVDAPLAQHLDDNGVDFIQFAFRWINCLLMRELDVHHIIRMWDTYLAEGTDAFSTFHLYVCLAFLVKWSDQLRSMDFQSIIIFLQSLPTQDWTNKHTELLLSEAFMWKSLFHDAHASHFSNTAR